MVHVSRINSCNSHPTDPPSYAEVTANSQRSAEGRNMPDHQHHGIGNSEDRPVPPSYEDVFRDVNNRQTLNQLQSVHTGDQLDSISPEEGDNTDQSAN